MATTAFDDLREAIETKIQTVLSGETIEFPNVPIDTPSTQWFRLTINLAPSAQVAMGATKRFRHTGVISVSVFTPKNESSIEAYQYADTIATALRNQSFDGVQALVPSVTPVGNSNEWFQLNVVTPFYFDEINTN